MDFWLCDLDKALKKIKEEYGHLSFVVNKIEPSLSGTGLVFFLSSGSVFIYNHKTDTVKEYKSVGKS
jgi:hypothetical protein